MSVKKDQIFLVSGRSVNENGHLIGDVQTSIVCSIDKESVRSFVSTHSPSFSILNITSFVEYETVLIQIKDVFQGKNKNWNVYKDPVLDC